MPIILLFHHGAVNPPHWAWAEDPEVGMQLQGYFANKVATMHTMNISIPKRPGNLSEYRTYDTGSHYFPFSEWWAKHHASLHTDFQPHTWYGTQTKQEPIYGYIVPTEMEGWVVTCTYSVHFTFLISTTTDANSLTLAHWFIACPHCTFITNTRWVSQQKVSFITWICSIGTLHAAQNINNAFRWVRQRGTLWCHCRKKGWMYTRGA